MKEKLLIELALFVLRYVIDMLGKKYPDKSAICSAEKYSLVKRAEELFGLVSSSWSERKRG